ncbi:unnamed protein product [Citrullus colocynthis]|uniref:Uncharacterized protein n=1 Tax=Citrullus colocynthis TaxID=252529 RepID=A0ABP0YV36_9ROSI
MEEFKAVRALKEKKITITSIYLTGDAKENPDGAGRTAVNRKLKKEVKDQFLPCNVAWLAPDSLRKGHDLKVEVSMTANGGTEKTWSSRTDWNATVSGDSGTTWNTGSQILDLARSESNYCRDPELSTVAGCISISNPIKLNEVEGRKNGKGTRLLVAALQWRKKKP